MKVKFSFSWKVGILHRAAYTGIVKEDMCQKDPWLLQVLQSNGQFTWTTYVGHTIEQTHHFLDLIFINMYNKSLNF